MENHAMFPSLQRKLLLFMQCFHLYSANSFFSCNVSISTAQTPSFHAMFPSLQRKLLLFIQCFHLYSANSFFSCNVSVSAAQTPSFPYETVKIHGNVHLFGISTSESAFEYNYSLLKSINRLLS